jgi:hypothetical protein
MRQVSKEYYSKLAMNMVDQFGSHNNDDLELARIIATQAIERYGFFNSEAEWDRFRKQGIWNDHDAVQAALVTIRLFHEKELWRTWRP